MRRYLIGGAVLPLALFCAPAFAQEAEPPQKPEATVEAAPAEAAPAACCVAPKNTIVQLAVVPVVSTKAVKRGDVFEIRLAEPLVVDGKTLLPAGLVGGGEVTHAAGPNIGGKPGELMLAARYLDFNGQRIALKGMKLGAVGKDNSTAVLIATSVVSPLLFVIPGGHVEVPAGALAHAKLAADFTFSPIAEAVPAAAEPASTPEAVPVAVAEPTARQEQ